MSLACMCASDECRVNGCQRLRNFNQPQGPVVVLTPEQEEHIRQQAAKFQPQFSDTDRIEFLIRSLGMTRDRIDAGIRAERQA